MPERPAEAAARLNNRFEGAVEVVSNRRIIENELEVTFLAPEIAERAQPGQFVMMIYGERYSSEDRRPFSLFRVNRREGTISILYLARGSFTSELARRSGGDKVKLAGPLGRPFDWKSRSDASQLLLAGGLGAPPIFFLASEMAANRNGSAPILVVNGARTADLLIGAAEFDTLGIEVEALTEDGSAGRKGLVTDRLKEELALEEPSGAGRRVYACGPMGMLREVAAQCLAGGIHCQVSIEAPMPCGVGECEACAVTVRDGSASSRTVRACMDGPVFEARHLVWQP